MVKNIALFLMLAFSFTMGFSQEKVKGNRNVVLNETPVEAFNKILLSEKFDVILVKGNTPLVEIEADENLHEIINFEVLDSVLSFSTTSKIISSKKLEIKIHSTEHLKEIELKESAEISALDKIENEKLILITSDNSRAYLNIRSAIFHFVSNGKSKSRLNIVSNQVELELNDNSNLEALIETDSLKAILYMHSKANIEGNTSQLELNTIASSDFTGKNLTVTNCILNTEDTSDVTVSVTESITINASGNSDILLYGDAKINLETFKGTATLQKKEF